jgi:putative transcriptional regulator
MKFKLKPLREDLGLTQNELAHMSGVSLPTIQNIESGKTNPGLEIAEKLLGALGFHLSVKNQDVDWDLMAALGAPLVALKKTNYSPSADILRRQVPMAIRALKDLPHEPDRERKIETIQALLLGLRTDFPTFYKKLNKLPTVQWIQALPLNPKVLKLKRQSVETLSKYL